MKYFLSIMLLLFVVTSFNVQSIFAEDWKIKGNAFVVPYLDGRDFLNETHPLTFTAMKLRLGVEKQVGNFTFNMALQTSKIFGDQANVVSTAAPVYILEGYIKYDSIFNIPLSLTAGRQQIEYNDGRFLGTSPWSYIERAHDGFRLSYKENNMFLDVFATKHTAIDASPSFNALPNAYPYPEAPYEDYDMLGFWYANKFGDKKSNSGAHNLDLFTYWEVNAQKDNSNFTKLDRFTSGFYYQWSINAFSAKAKMAYQYGTKGAKDVAASLIGVDVDYQVNEDLGIGLGTEMFSGTSPTETQKINTFDDYFGRKHGFLGVMDYFAGARNSYMGLGVNDFYIEGKYQIHPKWSISLTPHYFLSNQTSTSGKSDYGMEFDISLKYTLQKGIWIEWFNGLFMPGELMKEMYQVGTKERGDTGFSSYLRFNAAI
ncbi:MAG TPA: alginate export family protein [Candidatus Kapabacteria bacterium]|nr:alginate export family protein [Candidatus Kapabacteria bacterium]